MLTGDMFGHLTTIGLSTKTTITSYIDTVVNTTAPDRIVGAPTGTPLVVFYFELIIYLFDGIVVGPLSGYMVTGGWVLLLGFLFSVLSGDLSGADLVGRYTRYTDFFVAHLIVVYGRCCTYRAHLWPALLRAVSECLCGAL